MATQVVLWLASAMGHLSLHWTDTPDALRFGEHAQNAQWLVIQSLLISHVEPDRIGIHCRQQHESW